MLVVQQLIGPAAAAGTEFILWCEAFNPRALTALESLFQILVFSNLASYFEHTSTGLGRVMKKFQNNQCTIFALCLLRTT